MSKLGDNLRALTAAAAVTAASAAAPAAAPVAEQPLSVIQFDPAQRRMFNDAAPVVVVNWHRQKGKDFTAAAKAVRNALTTRRDWYIISLTQRQADATFAKCKRVAQAIMSMLQITGEAEEGPGFVSEQYDKTIKQSFTFLAREIRLPGGGRVLSLPGRDPDTLAGLTGNIILTEFGLFPGGGYDHWRVVFPLTTRGFQCVVISTPRGKNTKFYELASDPEAASVHTCNIWQSIAEGWSPDGPGGAQWVAEDVESLRKRYNDAAGWMREYECEFTGDASALITWAELERAASLPNPNGFHYIRLDAEQTMPDLSAFHGALRGRRLAIGWDVARRGHLSPVSVNLLEGVRPAELLLVIAMRDCSFDYMRRMVRGLMDLSYASVGYGDATGLGMESNETLQKRYGDRWTPHTFSAKGKLEVASALKTAFTDTTQTIPPLAGATKLIGTDLYAIQKDDQTERMTISETPNPLLDESHCDIAYSIGLARLAGARAAQIPLPPPRRQKPVGW